MNTPIDQAEQDDDGMDWGTHIAIWIFSIGYWGSILGILYLRYTR